MNWICFPEFTVMWKKESEKELVKKVLIQLLYLVQEVERILSFGFLSRVREKRTDCKLSKGQDRTEDEWTYLPPSRINRESPSSHPAYLVQPEFKNHPPVYLVQEVIVQDFTVPESIGSRVKERSNETDRWRSRGHSDWAWPSSFLPSFIREIGSREGSFLLFFEKGKL